MFPYILLDSKRKKAIFESLQTIQPGALNAALIAAALQNITFPIEDEVFSSLCQIYATMDCDVAKAPLAQTITLYFLSKIAPAIQKLLQKTFDVNSWRTDFLSFLAQNLNIRVQNQTLVQLAIKEGKVYWRIINGEQILYDRTARENQSDRFNFTQSKLITMTWEQFRIFKDSGKRGSSVAITKERFTNEFTKPQLIKASIAWEQLKQDGMLDKNNRLTYQWRYQTGIYSSSNITLDYRVINTALNTINANQKYAEQIIHIPNAFIYRPDRSPRNWASTGRMQNLDPKTNPNHRVKLWDVGIYRELDNHAVNDDGLDHDHIPSSSILKNKQTELIIQDMEEIQKLKSTKLNSVTPQLQNNLSQLRAENSNEWWCIALPKSLHRQGLSHGESSSAQKKQINKPFLGEVKDYLDKLEQNWQQSSVMGDEYLEALGAFRYLFRCHISGKYGRVSYRFFNEIKLSLVDVDVLFHERLQKFLAKKEGVLELS
ncbi:MAG: hypothetical protein ACHP6H_01875 [Legionellales bacterium]